MLDTPKTIYDFKILEQYDRLILAAVRKIPKEIREEVKILLFIIDEEGDPQAVVSKFFDIIGTIDKENPLGLLPNLLVVRFIHATSEQEHFRESSLCEAQPHPETLTHQNSIHWDGSFVNYIGGIWQAMFDASPYGADEERRHFIFRQIPDGVSKLSPHIVGTHHPYVVHSRMRRERPYRSERHHFGKYDGIHEAEDIDVALLEAVRGADILEGQRMAEGGSASRLKNMGKSFRRSSQRSDRKQGKCVIC